MATRIPNRALRLLSSPQERACRRIRSRNKQGRRKHSGGWGRETMDRIAVAALASAILLLAGAAQAQQPPAAPPAPPLIDWDKIQITTTDLGNNTYRLEGQGG